MGISGQNIKSIQSKIVQKQLIISLFVCILLIAACDSVGNKLEYDELGSKPEYKVLQEVEYENRNIIISKPAIITSGKYILAGFRTENGKGNTWVLLNVKHSPYYKQVPQENFTITNEDLEQIRKIPGVSYTVISVLETRLKNPRRK